MATNPYLNLYNNPREQSLVDNLVEETIRHTGIDVYYIPREFVKQDMLFGEDVLEQFSQHYVLEAYLDNPEGFEGEMEYLAKFGGIDIRDRLSLMFAKNRFLKVTEGAYSRPREGDLVFFPLNEKLFKITWVEHEQPFYQLGSLRVYKMKLDLMTYSHENIETGIPEIDSTESTLTDAITIVLTAGGSGAFLEGETAYQGTTPATATASGTVLEASPTEIKVGRKIGQWLTTERVKGETGFANWAITSINEFANDAISNNELIKEEGDAVIDFSESNPYGNPD